MIHRWALKSRLLDNFPKPLPCPESPVPLPLGIVENSLAHKCVQARLKKNRFAAVHAAVRHEKSEGRSPLPISTVSLLFVPGIYGRSFVERDAGCPLNTEYTYISTPPTNGIPPNIMNDRKDAAVFQQSDRPSTISARISMTAAIRTGRSMIVPLLDLLICRGPKLLLVERRNIVSLVVAPA